MVVMSNGFYKRLMLILKSFHVFANDFQVRLHRFPPDISFIAGHTMRAVTKI